eukprot:COSAG01_NODE_5868_length_3981_cov_7.697321_3_plen_90_part_00
MQYSSREVVAGSESDRSERAAAQMRGASPPRRAASFLGAPFMSSHSMAARCRPLPHVGAVSVLAFAVQQRHTRAGGCRPDSAITHMACG